MQTEANLNTPQPLATCPDCKAKVPDIPGPHPHKYFGGSPGCWQVYGEILAREYNDVRYAAVHRLTVDAYAVQHPGKPERRAIQSVNIHLVALHLVLVRKSDFASATKALAALTEHASNFRWLEPPTTLGAVTVNDILPAIDPSDHARLVRGWAKSVWDAWSEYHDEVAALASRYLG